MKQDLYYLNDEKQGARIFLGTLFECMILFFTLINEGARNIKLSPCKA